jgi:hypothetical protein
MITTFTRIQTDDLDSLIQDDELITSLVTNLGFDADLIKQLAGDASNADPETLFQTLESRWNGHGQIFSIEDQLPLLSTVVANTAEFADSALCNLSKAGRAIPTTIDGEHVRVIFPTQVDEINDSLTSFPVENLQAYAQQLMGNGILKMEHADLIQAPLWQLYDGLCTFFQNAADGDEHILVVHHKT